MKNLALLSLILLAMIFCVIVRPAFATVIEIHNPRVTPDTQYLPSRGESETGVRDQVRVQVLAMLKVEGIDTKKADRIIACESTWNPSAVNQNKNGSNDKGLWQINSIHGVSDKVRLDPIASTEFAIGLIKKKGFQPWVCNGLIAVK